MWGWMSLFVSVPFVYDNTVQIYKQHIFRIFRYLWETHGKNTINVNELFFIKYKINYFSCVLIL